MAYSIENNIIIQLIAEVVAAVKKRYDMVDITEFERQITQDLTAYQHEYRETKADLAKLTKQDSLYQGIKQYYIASCKKSEDGSLIFAPNIILQQKLITEIKTILSKSGSSYAQIMQISGWSQNNVAASPEQPVVEKLSDLTTANNATTPNANHENDEDVPSLIKPFVPGISNNIKETKVIS